MLVDQKLICFIPGPRVGVALSALIAEMSTPSRAGMSARCPRTMKTVLAPRCMGRRSGTHLTYTVASSQPPCSLKLSMRRPQLRNGAQGILQSTKAEWQDLHLWPPSEGIVTAWWELTYSNVAN